MAWLRGQGGVVIIIVLTVALLAIGTILFRQQQTPPLTIIEHTPVTSNVTTNSIPAPTQEKLVKVYVSGAVHKPDVYTLHTNDRIKEAIEAAGGATEDADLNRINLATRLRDEMQIQVPRKGEAAPPPTSRPAKPVTPSIDNKLNINTANAAELNMLPGIGDVTAAKIIAHREQHGPFKKIDELKDAKIVTNAVFERIKELILAE